MRKRNLALVFLLLAVLWGLLGCQPAAQAAEVDVSCDEFMAGQTPASISREITVPAGTSFKVALCSNQSTGYSWDDAQISDGSVLEESSHVYLTPKQNLAGAAGQEVWTFKALAKGTSTVSITYSQPWEGGDKAAWTFTLAVTVE